MPELGERLTGCELKIENMDKRLNEVEDDVDAIHEKCASEKVQLGNLDTKFDGLLGQLTLIATTNKESMTLIKWVITVQALIIAALLGMFGIKLALPILG